MPARMAGLSMIYVGRARLPNQEPAARIPAWKEEWIGGYPAAAVGSARRGIDRLIRDKINKSLVGPSPSNNNTRSQHGHGGGFVWNGNVRMDEWGLFVRVSPFNNIESVVLGGSNADDLDKVCLVDRANPQQ